VISMVKMFLGPKSCAKQRDCHILWRLPVYFVRSGFVPPSFHILLFIKKQYVRTVCQYSQYSFISSYFVTISFLCSVLNIFTYFILVFCATVLPTARSQPCARHRFRMLRLWVVISRPILDRFLFRDNQPKAMVSNC
jgi:hypothetical protein